MKLMLIDIRSDMVFHVEVPHNVKVTQK